MEELHSCLLCSHQYDSICRTKVPHRTRGLLYFLSFPSGRLSVDWSERKVGEWRKVDRRSPSVSVNCIKSRESKDPSLVPLPSYRVSGLPRLSTIGSVGVFFDFNSVQDLLSTKFLLYRYHLTVIKYLTIITFKMYTFYYKLQPFFLSKWQPLNFVVLQIFLLFFHWEGDGLCILFIFIFWLFITTSFIYLLL